MRSVIFDVLREWFSGAYVEQLFPDAPPPSSTPPARIPPLAGLHLEGLSHGGITRIGSGAASASTAAPRIAGPKGWLGWLVTHGSACVAYEIAFIDTQVYALSPSIKATWHSTSGGYVEFNTSDIDNMSQRFAELQCPVWGTGYGPTILCHRINGQTIAESHRERADVIGGYGGNGYLSRGIYLGGNHRYGIDPDSVVVEGVAPAAEVKRYWDAVDSSWEVRGRTINKADKWLAARAGNRVSVPSFWNTDGRRPMWRARMRQWFDTAQWLVWAAEMARVHSVAAYLPPPAWWELYANSWGVAVTPMAMVVTRQRYNHNNLYPSHADLKRLGEATDLSGYSFEKWQAMAKTLMSAAPPPGTPGYLGEQIADGEKRRHILDMPPLCGSLIPRLDYSASLANSFLRQWIARQDFHNLTVQVVQWFNAVIQMVASIFTTPAFTAWMGLMNAAYAGVCSLLQAISRMANEGVGLDAGADIVTGLYNCTTAIASMAGVDVNKMIPDGVWEALDTAGAIIPEWGGELSFQAMAEAKGLQNSLEELKRDWKWPYTSEAFSRLLPGAH